MFQNLRRSIPLTNVYKKIRTACEAELRKDMHQPWRVTPHVLGLPYEPLTLVTRDHLQLTAWYVPAAQSSPFPSGGIVLHHHFGGQKATLLGWIQLFHRLGLSVIAFDARGHGQSTRVSEQRDSFVVRRADVDAACDALKTRGIERLIVLGQSQGGAVAINAAGSRNDIQGVIVDSGPCPTMELASWGLGKHLLKKSFRTESTAFWMQCLVTLDLYRRSDPARYAYVLWKNLYRLRKRHLLWIHSDEDPIVRPAWVRCWFEPFARNNPKWSALLLPHGGHVRTLSAAPEIVEAHVRQFVERCLGS